MASKWTKLSIEELEKEVRHHNALYFVKQKPEISDEQYDKLVKELQKRRPDSPVLEEVGSDLTSTFQKVEHAIPILSLDKCYDNETLKSWAAKFEGGIVASPKIDGMAVSLIYDSNGKLVRAATRGDGHKGENITTNAMEVDGISEMIDLHDVEVRGEVFMPLPVFDNYRQTFKNPRNLAAGAIKQKNPRKTKEYSLSFLAYDLLGSGASTEMEKHKLLKKSFTTVDRIKVDRNDLQSAFNHFLEKRDRDKFETDGVVYKADRVDEQERLSSTASHPRFAIAYKFQGDSGETTLVDVEWSVSRTGAITPVAIVEPVTLSGAMVTRASLHNVNMMEQLGLSKGARVVMMRRGGVIPNLERVVKKGKAAFKVPSVCPSCGAPTERHDDFLYCTNSDSCVTSKVRELIHFIQTIECDGFGDKLVAQLYKNGLVTDASEFYMLTKEDLLGLERMGDTLAEKLLRNIESRRELDLDVFLRSLGIRELGQHVAKILASYGSLDYVLELKEEELAGIHTIGEVIAKYVVEGLKEKRSLITKLKKQVTVRKGIAKKKGALSGKSFLFTGVLLSMSRKDAQSMVEHEGGESAQGVTKDLDYLVVGDGGRAGSKLDKANKLQDEGGKVKVLSEKEFLKMVGK